jgi:undecaprenyl-diphosphatase
MSLFEAFVLGVLQGLTDVLPVSASGHRAFVGQVFFGENNYSPNFLGAMNLATALAVLLALRQDMVSIFRSLYQGRGRGRRIGLLVLAAVLPAAVILYAFREAAAGIYEDLFAMGVLLLVSGLLLYIGEELGKRVRPLESLSVPGAILVGLFQTLAVLPGISRPGAAICGAMLAGITREAAARFALLLSVFLLSGTGLWRILYLEPAEPVGAGSVAVGGLAALVCGYFAARVMVNLARELSMMIYAYYLWGAGVVVILFGTVFN